MPDSSLSRRFREQLSNAMSLFEKGDEHAMVDLFNGLWEEAFEDGRSYMGERAKAFLDEEMKGGGGVRDNGK